MSPVRLPIIPALTAAPATAAPYEQVNRATGAQGATDLWSYRYKGTAVGDIGRYAGWERELALNPGPGPALPEGFVRDIQTNTTYDYGGGVRRIYSIDRAETRVLLLRHRSGQREVAAVPITGGTPIVIARFAQGGPLPEAALSGDGRKAVVSAEGFGTKVFDLTGGVATLQRTVTSRTFYRFGPRAVNDDASVIIGADSQSGNSFYVYRGTVEFRLNAARAAALDAAGTTVAWVEQNNTPGTLVVRNLAAGTERRKQLEYGQPTEGVVWVAPGGSKVVIAPEGYVSDGGAKAYTFAANGTATWARFGGRYASSISSNEVGWTTHISANGRFALTRESLTTAITLFDLTDTHIVGANEGFSASSYLRAGSFVSECTTPTEFYVSMGSPTPFAAAPTKAVITAKVDGQVIASGTLTTAVPYGYYGPLPENGTVLIRGDYGPAATSGEVQLTATVTDGAGRVLTESWTEPDFSC